VRGDQKTLSRFEGSLGVVADGVSGHVDLEGLNSRVRVGLKVHVAWLGSQSEVRLVVQAKARIDFGHVAAGVIEGGHEAKSRRGFVGEDALVDKARSLVLQVQRQGVQTRGSIEVDASFGGFATDSDMRGTSSAKLGVDGNHGSVRSVSSRVQSDLRVIVVEDGLVVDGNLLAADFQLGGLSGHDFESSFGGNAIDLQVGSASVKSAINESHLASVLFGGGHDSHGSRVGGDFRLVLHWVEKVGELELGDLLGREGVNLQVSSNVTGGDLGLGSSVSVQDGIQSVDGLVVLVGDGDTLDGRGFEGQLRAVLESGLFTLDCDLSHLASLEKVGFTNGAQLRHVQVEVGLRLLVQAAVEVSQALASKVGLTLQVDLSLFDADGRLVLTWGSLGADVNAGGLGHRSQVHVHSGIEGGGFQVESAHLASSVLSAQSDEGSRLVEGLRVEAKFVGAQLDSRLVVDGEGLAVQFEGSTLDLLEGAGLELGGKVLRVQHDLSLASVADNGVQVPKVVLLVGQSAADFDLIGGHSEQSLVMGSPLHGRGLELSVELVVHHRIGLNSVSVVKGGLLVGFPLEHRLAPVFVGQNLLEFVGVLDLTAGSSKKSVHGHLEGLSRDVLVLEGTLHFLVSLILVVDGTFQAELGGLASLHVSTGLDFVVEVEGCNVHVDDILATGGLGSSGNLGNLKNVNLVLGVPHLVSPKDGHFVLQVFSGLVHHVPREVAVRFGELRHLDFDKAVDLREAAGAQVLDLSDNLHVVLLTVSSLVFDLHVGGHGFGLLFEHSEHLKGQDSHVTLDVRGQAEVLVQRQGALLHQVSSKELVRGVVRVHVKGDLRLSALVEGQGSSQNDGLLGGDDDLNSGSVFDLVASRVPVQAKLESVLVSVVEGQVVLGAELLVVVLVRAAGLDFLDGGLDSKAGTTGTVTGSDHLKFGGQFAVNS